jgi:hypothetical protein
MTAGATYAPDHFTAVAAPRHAPASSRHGRPRVGHHHQGCGAPSDGRDPVAVEHDGEHGADDEQRDQRVEHRDPRLHDGQKVGGEQPGRRRRAHRQRHPGAESAQQPPAEQVDERHARRPGRRDRHAPPERVVAEGRDPGADEPLPERRVRPAGKAADVADRLATGHVPAGVAGVEDLVEDQLEWATE